MYTALLAIIVLGAAAGWIASVVTRSRSGLFLDIVLGVVGAVIGGFIMTFLGQPGITGFDFYSLLVSAVGAIVLIWVGRLFSGPTERAYQ